MAHPDAAPAPVAELDRAGSVDALRGLAVLGILAMNIVTFSLPSGAYTTALNAAINQFAGEFSGMNAAVWWLNHLVFDQKMMSIFSMLFGAGVVLQDQAQAARIGATHGRFAGLYYRRLAILFVLGMLHAYGLWFGDILVGYALCGLLLYPARLLRPAWLIAIGLVIFSVAIVINVGLGALLGLVQRPAAAAQALLDAGESITDAQRQAIDAWKQTSAGMIPGEEKVLEEVVARRGGWLDNFKFNALLTIFFQTFLFFIWTLWRGLGLMLLGMGLAKLGFFAAKASTRTYATIALAGYAVGLPVIAFGAVRLLAREDDIAYVFGVGTQFNYVGSLLVALAHASVVMLLCKHGLLKFAINRLSAVGRMAFSNYLAQTVICSFIFFGFGLGYFGSFDRAQSYLFVLGVWIIQLIWSPLWLARFRFGPAEWLWRSLTYLRLQPLRR